MFTRIHTLLLELCPTQSSIEVRWHPLSHDLLALLDVEDAATAPDVLLLLNLRASTHIHMHKIGGPSVYTELVNEFNKGQQSKMLTVVEHLQSFKLADCI